MRYALVVLVPLCCGLTSGFIVPPGIREVPIDFKDDLNSIQSSASKSRNMFHADTKMHSEIYNVTTVNTTKPISNEESVNNSLNNDIYEHGQTKDADVQERSFIYLNRRSKKPLQESFYDRIMQRQHVDSNSHKSYLLNINSILEDLPRQFSIGDVGKNCNVVNATISNKPDHRCHAKLRDDTAFNSEGSLPPITNDQIEYLKLLKGPILRPKANFNDIGMNKIDDKAHMYLQLGKGANVIVNSPNSKRFKPIANQNIGYVEDTVQSDIKGDVLAKVYALNNTGQRVYYNTKDGDKLPIDSIIRNNLKEYERSIEGQKLNHENVLYCPDCVKKLRKHKLSSRLLKETICRCGHHLIAP